MGRLLVGLDQEGGQRERCQGGSIKLDLKTFSSAKFELRWISIDTGHWGSTATFTGGSPKTITAPGKGAWVAVIVKK